MGDNKHHNFYLVLAAFLAIVFNYITPLTPLVQHKRSVASTGTHSLSCVGATNEMFMPKFWLKWVRKFARVEKENFVKHAKELEHLIRINDPQIIFLERLGFVFKPEAKFDANKIHIPTYYEIWSKLNNILDDLQYADGSKVLEEDIIRPHRILYGTDDKVTALPLSKFGKELDETKMSEMDNLLKEEQFYPLIAARKFPLGETTSDYLSGRGATDSEHELAHFGAFVEEPDYMKSCIKIAKKYQEVDEREGGSVYLWYHFEALAGIKREFRNEVLELNQQQFGKDPQTVQEIMVDLHFGHGGKHLYDKADDIYNLAQDEIINFRKWWLPLGGASRDFFSRKARKGTNYLGNNAAMYSFADRLERILYRFKSFQIGELKLNDKQIEELVDETIVHLAKLRLYMTFMSKINYEQWSDEVIKGKMRKKTFLYKLFCHSGIFEFGGWQKMFSCPK